MQHAVLEEVHPDIASSIKSFTFEAEIFDAPYHFHPEYELTYIESSSGLRYVGNTIDDYQSGELVLLGSNLPHCWKNRDPDTKKAKSTVIQWKKELIGNHPELQVINHHLTTASRGIKYNHDVASYAKPILQDITHSNPLDAYLKLIKLLSYLSNSEGQTTLTGDHISPSPTIEFSSSMELIHQYVDANYKRKIKLKEIALTLRMSEQSFSRFFSKTMGKPFFQFLNEYRINVASRLILDTTLTINEIGYNCGYDSLPFFYRQFKKLKGETPLNFRKGNK